MFGCITEKNWDEMEKAFPGIYKYYRRLSRKPKTFLELQWRFLNKIKDNENELNEYEYNTTY